MASAAAKATAAAFADGTTRSTQICGRRTLTWCCGRWFHTEDGGDGAISDRDVPERSWSIQFFALSDAERDVGYVAVDVSHPCFDAVDEIDCLAIECATRAR